MPRTHHLIKTGRITAIEKTKRGIKFTFKAETWMTIHCWDTALYNDVYWAERTLTEVKINILVKDFKKHLTSIQESVSI